MILLDSRVGSKELYQPISDLGLPVMIDTLPYADIAFTGEGPDGPVSIGIERKTLLDLIESMRNGRLLGHQLPGLMDNYNAVYLLVEGRWEPSFGGDGVIMQWAEKYKSWRAIPQQSVRYKEVDSFLITLNVRGGVKIIKSGSLWESAHIIGDLHRWWAKDWNEHSDLTAMHKPKMEPVAGQIVTWTKPGLLRRIAAELPGIGCERSKLVEESFDNVLSMVNAEEKAWTNMDGIGAVTARKIWKALRGIR